MQFPRIWQRLTAPQAQIDRPDQQRRARLLSSFLLILIPIPVAVLILRLLTDPEFSVSPVSVTGILILIGLYALSRSRYYGIAAVCTVGLFPAAIFTICITNFNPADFRSLLAYLGLGVLLSSMLLSISGTIVLAVVSLFGIAALPLLIPEVDYLDILPPMTFLILLTLLILVAMRLRDLIEADRRGELIKKNRALEYEIQERKRIADALKKSEERYRLLNSQLEERVSERTNQLLAANQELEAFAYSVSHDLRAPLRGINGYANALKEDYFELVGEEGRAYIGKICECTHKMDQLISDLLNLSRISRREIRPVSVDLSSMAERISAELTFDMPERQFDFRISPGLTARGDEHLLYIALENLFSNALKFTARSSPAVITFGKDVIDHKPTYYLHDNGVGFNQDQADILFLAFQRLHSQEEYPGAGIGLSIVKRVIEKHGGRIWAEGIEQAGATFYFTLN